MKKRYKWATFVVLITVLGVCLVLIRYRQYRPFFTQRSYIDLNSGRIKKEYRFWKIVYDEKTTNTKFSLMHINLVGIPSEPVWLNLNYTDSYVGTIWALSSYSFHRSISSLGDLLSDKSFSDEARIIVIKQIMNLRPKQRNSRVADDYTKEISEIVQNARATNLSITGQQIPLLN